MIAAVAAVIRRLAFAALAGAFLGGQALAQSCGSPGPSSGTALNQAQLLTLFSDNQAAGAILPVDARDLICSLPNLATFTLFTSVAAGSVPASGGGTTNFLRADGTWMAPTGSGTVTSVAAAGTGGLTGTVTSAGSLTLNLFTSSLAGSVPASGGGTTAFLRADGTWAAPTGSGTVTSVAAAGTGGLTGTVTTSGNLTLNLFGTTTAGSVAASGGGTANFLRADDTWTVPPAVSSVATGTGLTGGTITSTGTISLAAIANHDVLANISGGSAAPIANTLTALIDDAIGSTRGAILERGSSGWALIAPGASTTVLTSNGAGADPTYQAGSGAGTVTSVGSAGTGGLTGTVTTSGNLTLNVFTSLLPGGVAASGGGTANFLRADGTWATPAGSGTVTSIATSTGITGGTITTTGTIKLATIADAALLANTSGGALAPVSTTLTAFIDYAIGSTRGTLLERGASGWALVGPGTAGQILTSNGAASDPAFASASGLGFTPVNVAGDTMLGELTFKASATGASGLNYPQGVAPTSPVNGDIWTTTTGLFERANGVTSGPFIASNQINVFSKRQTNAVVTLSDGATITPDLTLGNLYAVTLGGTRTLANPTGLAVGWSGCIQIINGTGTASIGTWGTAYTYPGGTAAITFTATLNAVDEICGRSYDGTTVQLSAAANYTH